MERSSGFSLIELIIILAVVGLLAWSVIFGLGDIQPTTLDATARTLVSDIRYAQGLAMTQRRAYQVTLAPGSYSIIADVNQNGVFGEAGEAPPHPLFGSQNFVVTLPSGVGLSATCAAGGGMSLISFTPHGGLATCGGTLSLTTGGSTETVSLTAQTGLVSLL